MDLPGLQRIEEHYEVLGKLGEGGMGAIYKVRHRLLGEERVVKVMRAHLSDDEGPRSRFLREALAAVKLRHPNIAQIHDLIVDDDGTAFMVIEFIDGRNLKQIEEERGLLAVETVLSIATQALRALGYLHRRGFVHRDVSPDNLMLSEDVDGSPLVKLIDLGIAKPLTETLGAGMRTQEGMFIGKLRYASPEQFGVGELDARSDLYSFGIVLYEMLTGIYPIAGSDFASLAMGHLQHPPRPFDESDPHHRVPPSLRAVVEKALAKAPEDRFQSAEQLSAVIETIRLQLETPSEPTLMMPAPGAARDAAGRSTDTVLDEEQISALFAGARMLVRLGQFDEAEAQVGAVARARPDHPAAQALLAEIATERELAAGRRQALDEALEEISRLLETKDLEGAARSLEAAIGEHGAAEELRLLENDLERRRVAEQVETADRVLDEARQLRAAGDLDAASQRLERARSLAPGRPGLDQLAAALEADREQRREARIVAEARQAHQRALGAMERGDLDVARRLLQELSPAHREAGDFAAVERRIGALEKAADHAERMAVIIEAIAAQLSQGRLEMAADALVAARRRYGDDPALAPLERQVAAARTAAEERARVQRQERVAAVIEAASEVLSRGDAESALTAVSEALRLDPGSVAGLELMRRAETESVRLRALAEAQEGIAAALDRGDLDRASKSLRAARRSFGDHPGLGALATRLNDREGARANERALDKKLQNVERLLARSTVEAASKELAEAVAVHGESVAARRLRTRIDQAFEAALAKEREARRQVEASRTGGGPAIAPRSPTRWLLAVVAAALAVVAGMWLTRGLRSDATGPAPPARPYLETAEAQAQLAGYDFGAFRALLIANNVYPKGLPSLGSAVADAGELGRLLEARFGFTVEVLTDATRYQIMTALERSVRELGERDNLLVFYAGHGILEGGNGYWAAYDSEPGATSAWIPNSDVADLLRDAVARRVLLIADSCFSGSLVPTTPETVTVAPPENRDQVDQLLERKARQVLTSGALQPVLDAGSGTHSVFAAALLEGLAADGQAATIEARTLYLRLQAQVEDAAGKFGLEQQPQFAPLDLDEGGSFFFVAR